MNPVRFRVETDKSISSVCFFPGGHGGVATPVPIPNTEVKGSSGEGTAGIARGRVARCQDFFSGEDVIGYPPLFLLCRISARGGGGGEPPRALGEPPWAMARLTAPRRRGGEPPRANIAGEMRVGDGGAKLAVRNGARNGGRARCPHRAARVMRVPPGRG